MCVGGAAPPARSEGGGERDRGREASRPPRSPRELSLAPHAAHGTLEERGVRWGGGRVGGVDAPISALRAPPLSGRLAPRPMPRARPRPGDACPGGDPRDAAASPAAARFSPRVAAAPRRAPRAPAVGDGGGRWSWGGFRRPAWDGRPRPRRPPALPRRGRTPGRRASALAPPPPGRPPARVPVRPPSSSSPPPAGREPGGEGGRRPRPSRAGGLSRRAVSPPRPPSAALPHPRRDLRSDVATR